MSSMSILEREVTGSEPQLPQAIVNLRDSFNRSDIDTVSEQYGPGADLFPAGPVNPIAGRENIAEFYKSALGLGQEELILEFQGVSVITSDAMSTRMVLQNPEGETIDAFKATFIFKDEKIVHHHMSSAPLPEVSPSCDQG